MGKRLLPVVFFLLLSIFLLSFLKSWVTPFDFLAFLASSPREFLYSSAHANSKPTELDLLKQENISLRAKLVKFDSLQKDNNALRSQFEDTFTPSEKLLPAKVIGSTGSNFSPSVLILNQGISSGVKSGMAVVAGHILLGKIGKVTGWSSELILTVSKNFSTLGIVVEHSTSGVVHGTDDFILFDHVVITDSVYKGDTVASSGEVTGDGAGLPADLLIGKITTVNKSDSSPFQSAVVKPLIDFKKLKTVFIIK